MKRIVASLGVAALGAATVDSSNAQGVGGDGSKSWSVSVALRGFYDDNVRTANTGQVETFGFEVSPSLGTQLQLDQTTLSLAYTYSFRYYDKRPESDYGHDDQTHTIAARLLHAFTERTSVSVGDSFVIGQEPDVIRTANIFVPFQSISGDNIRNYGFLTVNHQFSPKFGVEVGYANALFDYEARGAVIFGNQVLYSRSGALDRLEHAIHADARWTVQPTTIALVGYEYGLACYTGDELIGYDSGFGPIYSGDRDSQSHYGYVGVEHSFRSDLQGNLRVGGLFTEYPNSPLNESTISPKADASLRYMYGRDSHLEVGVSHALSASDVFSVAGDSITTDIENTIAFGTISHRLLPDLTGTLMAQYMHSTFNGGVFDGWSDDYFLASVSLSYRINRHIFATLSYHYDKLESNVPARSFDRNRVYLGAVFTY
jgi:hypothetical protein